MPMRARRRLHLGWGHHFGWHHPLGMCPACGGPAGWGPPWWASRPSRDEEKQMLTEYVAALKEELEDAEEHLKELEAGK